MPLNRQDFTIKRNDTLPSIQVCIIDKDCLGGKQPFLLTNVTGATFSMVNNCGEPKIIGATAQISSSSGGTIQYNWTSEDTSEAGIYDGEFQLLFAGGGKMSIPQDKSIRIEIFKDVNPY